MKVNPNQSSGIPAPVQESEAKVKDGTSNTVQFAESSKPEKPFAKDSFESPKFERGLPCSALDASSKDAAKFSVASGQIKSPRDAASRLKANSNEVAMETLTAREKTKGVEREEAAKGHFMDYTDDSFESPRSEKIGFPTLDGSSKDAAFIRGSSGNKSPRDSASGLKSDSNEVAVETLEVRKSVKGKTPRGEATTPKLQNAIDIESKKLERDGENVVENLNVKYTMFLPDE